MSALQCAYLIVGSDELKRQAALRRLKARLDPAWVAFNLEEMPGASADKDRLVASLNTLPVGDTLRVVIVSEAERLAKATVEALVAYLANPNPTSVLALVAEKLAKNTRLYKAVAALGPRTVLDCTPKRRWELPAHVTKMALSHGMTMDAAAAQELIARVGESTVLLDAQLATLAELCSSAGYIDVHDVEAHVARSADVQPWDFLDAVCARDLGKALELYACMRRPSQVALTAMLAGRVRELICARCLTERGQASLLATELGKQAWQVKNHQRWANAFGAGELEGLLKQCAACDGALKGGADADLSFTSLIVAACTGIGQLPATSA